MTPDEKLRELDEEKCLDLACHQLKEFTCRSCADRKRRAFAKWALEDDGK